MKEAKGLSIVKRVGADVGNDYFKLYLEEPNFEGKSKLEVMNVVAPGYNRRILGMEKGHLSNLLDVNIEIDGEDIGRYFVGGLAFKESRNDLLEKNKLDVKALSEDTIILLITGLAYGLYDPSTPVKSENIALGTLLPTEEFFSENKLIEKFTKNFNKKYKVKFNSPTFKNAEITINIVDYDVQPESVAGHLASIFNLDGTQKDSKIKIENEVHLGIFIGSITTEVSLFEHGEFNSKGLFGLEIGTSDPLDRIIEDLGIDISRHHVDHLIRNKKELIINRDGKAVNYTEELNKSAKKRFGYFTKQLVNQINKKLTRQGINVSLISKVNLGGGGGITTESSFVESFGVGNIKLVPDARFANAQGALFSIIQKQREQAVAADEVLS